MADPAPARLGLSDAVQWLRSPYAAEELALSPLPLVVVDVDPADAGDRVADHQVDDTVELLHAVRAVTVAVLASPPGDRDVERIVDALDIVVAPEGEHWGHSVVEVGDGEDLHELVSAVGDAVRAHPLAAVALAQLLRMDAYADVAHGLVLESLTYSMLQAGPEFARWLAARGSSVMPDDPEPPVVSQRTGTALELTLNRPARANAVTAAMRDLLVEQLRMAAADPTLDGVVLRGAGPSFCSGGDLAEFGTLPDPATAHATRLTRSPAWWVHRSARNVRVHLHGSCIGAGIEIPSFAGTVVAAPDTVVRLPEVAMGLVPGAGGTVGIPRRIGRQRTMYLALTGRELTAAHALAWGLVDRIEP